jgi:hypothetical protein
MENISWDIHLTVVGHIIYTLKFVRIIAGTKAGNSCKSLQEIEILPCPIELQLSMTIALNNLL